MTAGTVAALFVDPSGTYAGRERVELWDEQRDARGYHGPWPVVAHPPCSRWCALAPLVEHVHGYRVGDDGGTFAAALGHVRTFGGVLEHPAYSVAWDAFGLPRPDWRGGWTGALDGGWACYVEQGRYGAPVRKGTWLYAYGVELPDLRWGWTPPGTIEWEAGWRTDDQYRKQGTRRFREREASLTPDAFADELLAMARTAHVPLVGADLARSAS